MNHCAPEEKNDAQPPAATCGGANGSLFARMGFVLSHPCANKKAQGWGTEHITLFIKML
jgi:hypothetical protein